MSVSLGVAPRGHRFVWFYNGAKDDGPPLDGTCEHCGATYAEVKQRMHFCLGAWAKHPHRVAFVRALQGCE